MEGRLQPGREVTREGPLDSGNPRRKQKRKRGGENKGGRMIKERWKFKETEGRW